MKKDEYSASIWISILYRYRRSFIMKKLEKYGSVGGLYLLTMTIYSNNGCSQEQLSKLLRTDKASIARSVKKLEKDGYVVREADEVDKRANKVYLTPKALTVVPEIEKVKKEWDDLVSANISDEEIKIIEKVMSKMAENACNIDY